jgi:CheY-like chemotaxis protein
MEVGYMYALGRRLLLLKERRMPAMPTDIVGRIYRPFDSYKISETVGLQVREWVERDLGIHATPRVVLFDGDRGIVSLLTEWIRDRIGWDVTAVQDREQLVEQVETLAPDLIVLEILGNPDLLVELRRVTTAPILVLTAIDWNVTLSLESGADDFLVKPFDVDEFSARVQALVRRARGDWPSPRFKFG